ncbi:MAG: helix-turn-helix transcriptional regulator [Candidatus Eremiobacteraeota bacterium]|nr:helix-turn-helix transcriptional regulator [Candidatus Eremiobacteraeota bacterium]MBV8367142.1 helix-turn-helix transcriptional regulator [Candidatus Eremiobacteraeota bacterium]
MLRRMPSAIVTNGDSRGFGSVEGPLSRSRPAALLVAPDDSVAMAAPEALERLREATPEAPAADFRSLPQGFRTHLRELRHALLTSAAPVIMISQTLACRACVLHADGAEYLLLLFEPATRRDAAREQLDMFGFTPREHEVAALMTEGLSNRDIADRLCVTENTVESHIKRILTKAHVPSRAALVSKVLGGSSDGRP